MQFSDIPFNKPVTKFFDPGIICNLTKFCGDGNYTEKCSRFIENRFQVKKCLMTTSCTHALEMAAILIDIQPGDEVIMPSFTFVSTANAFVLRGAKIVFVDVRPDTMNIDEKLIESAITSKTRAIVPVHYAGVACEMDTILEIANKYCLYVIEDAAQGVMSTYKGRALGSIGHFGAFSFHETKNYHCGEGGALLINSIQFNDRAEIIREKGTNRSRFFRGQVDKYTWVDIGSSYLPSEINMAYLWGQLEAIDNINQDRLKTWKLYLDGLSTLAGKGLIELPTPPHCTEHNAHMFYIKLKDLEARTKLIEKLKEQKIQTAFHYVPLHTSPAGQEFGFFHSNDNFTTKESERLVRLPLWYGMTTHEVQFVISSILESMKTF